MKKALIYILINLSVFGANMQTPEAPQNISGITSKIDSIQTPNNRLTKDVAELIRQNKKATKRISNLQGEVKELNLQIDNLQKQIFALSAEQKTANETLSGKLDVTHQEVQTNQQQLSSRTIWGISSVAVLLVVIGAIVMIFIRKFKAGATSIDQVRKAQDTLREAQTKMQEESIKLDNQLLAIIEKQIAMTAQQPIGNATEPDHSLAKKVADEIVCIELNLSHMDSSIKGHKQLAKAVQRIKNNFSANGYEIVDMLGKPYDEGMKVVADFSIDDTLPEGAQIITSITKPQINYNGQMIQAAQIRVSQNI